jgi:pimeloyl-ACP methyl ester carboxylesterase
VAVPRRRVFYPFVILLLVLMFPGCWDRSQADTFVDIGGYRLAARCIGQGAPTVILESGLGSSSGSWREVQPTVSELTRVCSYDRAGLALSDNRLDTTIEGGFVADELHKLIAGLGLQRPFVFVGASIGGMYTRLYDERYPGEAAGMVFVDSSHEDQFERFDAEATVQHFADEGGSEIDFRPVIDELHQAGGFGEIPVISIDSGKLVNDIFLDLRRDLAARSTNSMLVVANEAGHEIQHDQPEVVIRSIRLVVESSRQHLAMGDCGQAFSDLDAECLPLP